MNYSARNGSTPIELTPPLDVADHAEFLDELGGRLREQRERLALSRKAAAKRANVSERFLASVETGVGNISVTRLFSLASALNLSLEELFRDFHLGTELKRSVALLGIRGAGKSSVGRELARHFRVRFVELDEVVAKKAGMSLATLFEIHGERHFRKLERETLQELLKPTSTPRLPVVIATSGSLVTDTETYRMLRNLASTVWLKAQPKDHWDRVVAQGDGRPMSGRNDAMQELRALFDARKALYKQAAHTIDTSGKTIEEVTRAVAAAATAPQKRAR